MGDFGHQRGPGAPLPSPQGLIAARCARAEWLSDEVAIDFPSIHAVVESIRAGFLGEVAEEPVVAADLALTRGEAARGATVPVLVRVRMLCAVCGGRGEVWAEPCRPCDGHGGSVVAQGIHVSVPPGVRQGERLRVLVGTHGFPPTRVELRVAIT